MKIINFAYSTVAALGVVVNAPVAVVHAYLLRLCCSYFAPFRAFTSCLYEKKMNYLPYLVQTFLKIAALGRF